MSSFAIFRVAIFSEIIRFRTGVIVLGTLHDLVSQSLYPEYDQESIAIVSTVQILPQRSLLHRVS